MRENLLGGIKPTLLPEELDGPARQLLDEGVDAAAVAVKNPVSPLAWATLAQQAFAARKDVEGYAFARVGYHRGLDALRKAGWRGQGPIPWSHEPNRGVLAAFVQLYVAARKIEEYDEQERLDTFITSSDPSVWDVFGVER